MNLEFCRRLRAHDTLVGTIAAVDSIAVMEVLSASGLDWIFIDSEHAPLDAAALQRMVAAAATTPCLVRLPDHSEVAIKRALDLGAAGIIVPQVNTREQAEAVVTAARFPPDGRRGVGVCRANGYGYSVTDYLAQANQGTAVIVQAEHFEAVENIDAIASTPGVDAVFVGPNDLSASFGLPGQFDHPEVAAAIARVVSATREAGKALGYFSGSPGEIRDRIAQGFSLVACGVDLMLLGAAARAMKDDITR